MARVVFQNAILSGKQGGTVYAKNKGGAYTRQFVKPTNPNTLAQRLSRNAFSQASKDWRGLSMNEKNQWETFAQTNFQPLRPKAGTVYSGFQAFVSLRNVIYSTLKSGMCQVTSALYPTHLTHVEPYAAVDTPPSKPLDGNIQLLGVNKPPVLSGFAIDVNGAFNADIDIQQTGAISRMEDGFNEQVGFAFFMSNALKFDGQFVQNPYKYCLGFAPSYSAIAPYTLTSSIIRYSAGGTPATANCKSFPTEGQIVRITLMQTSLCGQMIPVDYITAGIQNTLP